ncbi:unnamed protein product [Enterobius vermicularis]|uniref:Histone deacetylase complex subunit SAP130 n=1 Tax=Enterobius vermicularis TaxID=51028 RepID=A0A0N4UZZ2_ENTVE|nr:unnamed protein product [Enterobius vermicularis]
MSGRNPLAASVSLPVSSKSTVVEFPQPVKGNPTIISVDQLSALSQSNVLSLATIHKHLNTGKVYGPSYAVIIPSDLLDQRSSISNVRVEKLENCLNRPIRSNSL